MASICKDPGGRKRVLFVHEDGSRKAIRLGKATMAQAQAFRAKLQNLVIGRFSGIDPETALWVAGLPDDMHAKLAGFGLVEPRTAVRTAKLGPFIEKYIEARQDLKASTILVLRQAQQSLVEHFGADKPLREIHEGDAEAFRLALVGQGLAEATIRKRSQNAKQFFASAKRQRLVDVNPFAGLKSSAVANDSRLVFIPQADVEKVIAACPDTEWRLIFALCRFAGLRCPSEVFRLRWDDILWQEDRMVVHSSKTARHPGGESRIVPIFAELRPYLLTAFEEAPDGATYCISRHRLASANLRTTAIKIIKRAGLTVWTRTFQNLRASCETELCQRFPLHTVTAWLGNSQPVAMRHYLKVRDEDFRKAAQNPAREAARKAAQYGAESPATSSTERKRTPADGSENRDMLVGAGSCDPTQQFLLAPRGFEPLLPG